MTDDVITALDLAGNQVAEELTVDLRNRVVEIGWPTDLADGVSIVFDVDTSSFSIQIDPEYEEKVYDIEYGDGNLSPLPVLRTFENGMNREASPRLDVLFQEHLIRIGVL